jgi:hypothetical protein
MLTRINPSRIIAPSYDVWLEAAVMAGILARTESTPKPDRPKFLNDAILFCRRLTAAPSWSAEIPVTSIYYCN